MALFDQLNGQPGAEPALKLIRETRGPLLPHERRKLFEIVYLLEMEHAIAPLARRPAAWRKVLNSEYSRYRRERISKHAEFIRFEGAEPARQLLVVFTTAAGGLFMSQVRFLLLLGDAGCDVLWLRPGEDEDYPGGVPGYAKGFPALCARLRDERSNYASTVAIGASLGGYAALRAAILANMDVAVSFSGRFSAPRRWLNRPKLGAFDPLCACTPLRSRLIAYHAAGNPEDTAHAEQLGRMCARATIIPVGGYEHNVVATLAAERRLEAIFRELILTSPPVSHPT